VRGTAYLQHGELQGRTASENCTTSTTEARRHGGYRNCKRQGNCNSECFGGLHSGLLSPWRAGAECDRSPECRARSQRRRAVPKLFALLRVPASPWFTQLQFPKLFAVLRVSVSPWFMQFPKLLCFQQLQSAVAVAVGSCRSLLQFSLAVLLQFSVLQVSSSAVQHHPVPP